jgi:CRISPR/Cas system-associated exonuclease Cas4 (RecB family)
MRPLPKPILDYFIKVSNLEEPKKPRKNLHTIGLKALIKCLRKARFKALKPKLPADVQRSAWYLYWGYLIDRELTSLFEDSQKTVELKVDSNNKIIGVYDFIWDNRVWDVKVKFVDLRHIKAPYKEDVAQIALYSSLQPVKNATLLYLNTLGYKTFDVVDDSEVNYGDYRDVDTIKQLLLERAHIYFDFEKFPKAERSDDCAFCEYQEECRKMGW